MALDIEVDVDAGEAGRFVQRVFRDQLPFATSLALNRTALDFQERQREHQKRIFQITRQEWMDRAVKISPFARKNRPWTKIEIAPPGGKVRRGSVITKFEDQEWKLPYRRTHLLVPTRNVLGRNKRILEGWRPKDLRLRVWKKGPKAKILRGKRGTFMIRYNEGFSGSAAGAPFEKRGSGNKNRGIVFERDGPDLNPLYVLRRRVDIEPELKFGENAKKTVAKRWAPNFTAAFDRSISTARSPRVVPSGAGRFLSAASRIV